MKRLAQKIDKITNETYWSLFDHTGNINNLRKKMPNITGIYTDISA